MNTSIKHLLLPAALLAAALSACQKPAETRPEKPEIDQSTIEFSVKVSALETDGATVTMTHNGTDAETYYGFYYTDLETSVTDAINRVAASLTESGADMAEVLFSGTTYITILKDLDPLTTYRYVVFGMNEDKSVYGTPASADFTTLKGPVNFTVSVSGITQTSANASVTSTGDATDTWYCFATEDLTSPLADVVASEVAELGSDLSSVLRDGNDMVQLSGLSAGKSYRAVVTGLRSDGTTYGTPVAASFRTSAPDVDYVENPNWTVTYAGKGSYQGSPADLISVTVSGGSDTYTTGVITVEDFGQAGIQAFVESMVASYQEMLDLYNAMGMNLTWADILYTRTEEEMPYDVLDSSVEWYAVAFGVDLDGKPTGLYSISEPFTPEELEASDAYNKWLGTWTVTGANGTENVLEISALSPDLSYTVRGWQFGDYSEDWPGITASFNADGSISFMSEEYGSYDTGDYGVGTLGCFGIVEVQGQTSPVSGDSYPMCTATLTGDNTAEAVGEEITLSNNNTYEIVGMEYIVLLSGQYDGYVLSFEGDIPTFPLSMTKEASSAATRTVRMEYLQASAGVQSPLKIAAGTTSLVKMAE